MMDELVVIEELSIVVVVVVVVEVSCEWLTMTQVCCFHLKL